MRPLCPSVGPNGLRCRRRVHGPVPADPMPPIEECHVAYGWQGMDVWDDETAIDPPVQTVSMGEVVWDVAALVEAAANLPVVQVPVIQYVDPDLVNPAHWRTVDVHTPIILAPHPDTGRLVALDGRHRLYKAYRLGMETIGATTLQESDEYAARMTPERIAEVEEAHAAWQRFVGR